MFTPWKESYDQPRYNIQKQRDKVLGQRLLTESHQSEKMAD